MTRKMKTASLRPHRPLTRALVVVSALAAASVAAGATTAQADSSYTATGQADGFDVRITNQAIPLLSAVTLSGPTAQATLDSLDQSNAFAAFPYPGDEETGIIGLFGSVLGVPVPSYPAYVSTSYGQPAQDQDLTGVELQAQSTHSVSSAKASAGGAGTVKASSSVRNELDSSGGVGTVSTATVSAFSFGNVLTINGLSTTASASRDSTGKLTTSSHLTIGQISVPGVVLPIPTELHPCQINQLPVSGIPPFDCPPQIAAIPIPAPLGGSTITQPEIGFEDGTFTLTLPELGNQTFALNSDAVFAAFKTAGIDVSYQKPVVTSNGITGAALVFHQTLPASPVAVPSNPILGTPGITDATYSFGRASAAVDLTAFDTTGSDDASVPVVAGVVPITGDSSTPPAVTPSSTVTANPIVDALTPPAAGDGTGLASTYAGSTVSDGSGSPPPDVASGSTTQGTTPAAALAGRRSPLTDTADLYLALVAAAVLALGATQVVRIVGVRKLWAS